MHKNAKNIITVLLLIFCAICLIAIDTSTAKLYKWADEKGNIHITDYPQPEPEGSTEEKEKTPAVKETPQTAEVKEEIKETPSQFPEKTPEPEKLLTEKSPIAQTTPVATPTETQIAPSKIETTAVTTPTLTPTPAKEITTVTPVATPQTQTTVAEKTPEKPMATPTTITTPLNADITPKPVPTLAPEEVKKFVFDKALPQLKKLIPIVIAVSVVTLIAFIYALFSLYKIAKKLKVPHAWLSWIPAANFFTMLQAAQKPLWWILLILFIPIINPILFVIIWIAICERLGINKKLGLLMIIPIVFSIIILPFVMPVAIMNALLATTTTSLIIAVTTGVIIYAGSMLTTILPGYYLMRAKKAEKEKAAKAKKADDTVKLPEGIAGRPLDDTGITDSYSAPATTAAVTAAVATAGLVSAMDKGIDTDLTDDIYAGLSSEEFAVSETASTTEKTGAQEEPFTLDTAEFESQIEKAEGINMVSAKNEELTLDLDTEDFGIDITSDIAEGKGAQTDIEELDEDDTTNILVEFENENMQFNKEEEEEGFEHDEQVEEDSAAAGLEDDFSFDIEDADLELSFQEEQSISNEDDTATTTTDDEEIDDYTKLDVSDKAQQMLEEEHVEEGISFDIEDAGLELALDEKETATPDNLNHIELELEIGKKEEFDFELNNLELEIAEEEIEPTSYEEQPKSDNEQGEGFSLESDEYKLELESIDSEYEDISKKPIKPKKDTLLNIEEIDNIEDLEDFEDDDLELVLEFGDEEPTEKEEPKKNSDKDD
ncbi:MAG: DUF4124 domain-containing protein [Candidatus Magnetoovum sp. WYHC-5]|nr:DUF4124 domain-containing protein [Candidatus Magnetoovum sp. WYHC-5]